MKCSCLISTLAQHITCKISCYLLLLVIIRKLDTEGAFKRGDYGAYTLIREIAAVCYHIEHVCLNIELTDFCIDANTGNFAAIIANLTNLYMLGGAFRCVEC